MKAGKAGLTELLLVYWKKDLIKGPIYCDFSLYKGLIVLANFWSEAARVIFK
jgi:hypothetical protein